MQQGEHHIMAGKKYSQFHTSFWESSMVESLEPLEKLVYLYFITAPASNIEGVYELRLRAAEVDTGVSRDVILATAKKLEEKRRGGIFEDSEGKTWVVVSKAMSRMAASPPVIVAAADLYALLPRDLIDYMRGVGYYFPEGTDPDSPGEQVEQSREKLRSGRKRSPSQKEAPETAPKRGKGRRRGPKADTEHPELGVPMNGTRYNNLVEEYGKSAVEQYLKKIVNWEAAKKGGVSQYDDYAAACSDWLDRDGVQKKLKDTKPAIDFDPSKLARAGRD